MSARRAVASGLAVAAALAATMAVASPAMAAGGATWTGAGTSATWSTATNWSGAAAPTSPVTELSLPSLACGIGTICDGTDDLGSLQVGELSIDDGTAYQQYAADSSDTIELTGNGATGNVGLTTTDTGGGSGFALFGVPIQLSGSTAQTWNVNGPGTLNLGPVSGSSTPLTINLGPMVGGGYLQVGNMATGAATVTGAGDLELDGDSAVSSPTLPALTLTGATFLTDSAASAKSGAINLSGGTGDLQIYGDPGRALTVDGALTLGSANGLDFDIDGNAADLGNSLSASSVNLGGAAISLYEENYTGCPALVPGLGFTLISSTNPLTGSLDVNGHMLTGSGQSAATTFSMVPDDPHGCNVRPDAIITYSTNSITATIAGPPSAGGSAPKITGTPTVGDTLSVSGNGTWGGYPAPTYTYQWLSCSSGSCTSINGATRSSYQLASTDAGRTIEVKVTATNSYGSASATSNALGPVQAAPTTTVQTTTTPPPPTIKPASRELIRTDLRRLSHPAGRRAINLLLRRHAYSTRFNAPSSGALTVVWRARVMVGSRRHRRLRTFVIARGSMRARAAGRVMVTIHLTAAGRLLLREHRFTLNTVATTRFRATTGGWNTYVTRFRL